MEFFSKASDSEDLLFKKSLFPSLMFSSSRSFHLYYISEIRYRLWQLEQCCGVAAIIPIYRWRKQRLKIKRLSKKCPIFPMAFAFIPSPNAYYLKWARKVSQWGLLKSYRLSRQMPEAVVLNWPLDQQITHNWKTRYKNPDPYPRSTTALVTISIGPQICVF